MIAPGRDTKLQRLCLIWFWKGYARIMVLPNLTKNVSLIWIVFHYFMTIYNHKLSVLSDPKCALNVHVVIPIYRCYHHLRGEPWLALMFGPWYYHGPSHAPQPWLWSHPAQRITAWSAPQPAPTHHIQNKESETKTGYQSPAHAQPMTAAIASLNFSDWWYFVF